MYSIFSKPWLVGSRITSNLISSWFSGSSFSESGDPSLVIFLGGLGLGLESLDFESLFLGEKGGEEGWKKACRSPFWTVLESPGFKMVMRVG